MYKTEICCDYRSIANGMMVGLISVAFIFLIYISIILKSFAFVLLLMILLILDSYYVLQMMNNKVVLTEDELIEYTMFGKCKKYNLYELTKIQICKEYRKCYVLIFIGMKKIKIKQHARNYEKFESQLCRLLGIREYSRKGTHTYSL